MRAANESDFSRESQQLLTAVKTALHDLRQIMRDAIVRDHKSPADLRSLDFRIKSFETAERLLQEAIRTTKYSDAFDEAKFHIALGLSGGDPDSK